MVAVAAASYGGRPGAEIGSLEWAASAVETLAERIVTYGLLESSVAVYSYGVDDNWSLIAVPARGPDAESLRREGLPEEKVRQLIGMLHDKTGLAYLIEIRPGKISIRALASTYLEVPEQLVLSWKQKTTIELTLRKGQDGMAQLIEIRRIH